MDALVTLLKAREDDILERVFELASRHGYTRYSSTLIEAWRMSVRGLIESLVKALEAGAPLDCDVDQAFGEDEVARFGREAAMRHRARGVSLPMFLGLTRYYREGFIESVSAAVSSDHDREHCRHVITRLFDRIELSFCEAWCEEDARAGTRALQHANRCIANEKNAYLSMLESLSEGVLVVGSDGKVSYANPVGLEALGHAAEPGAAPYGVVLDEVNEHPPAWLSPLSSGGQACANITTERRTWEAHVRACLDITGRTEGQVVVLRDVTETLKQEAMQRELQTLFDSAAQNAHDGMFFVDPGGVVNFANPSAARILDTPVTDLVGQRFDSLIELVSVRGANPSSNVRRGRKRDVRGGPPLELTISPVPTAGGTAELVLFRDVSARNNLESEASAWSRVDAISRLSAGIAHEINNPVQFLGNSLSFIKGGIAALAEVATAAEAEAPEGTLRDTLRRHEVDFLLEELPRAVERATIGVDRIEAIVRAMRELGTRCPTMAPADLNRALRNVLMLVQPSWKNLVQVRLELTEMPRVRCHIDQLTQVFLNLLVNAADAIVERGAASGLIVVRSRVLGANVEVEIEDDGVGISDAVRAQVFEPFFSTKRSAQASGIGLSLARHIVVTTHKGAIDFRANPRFGTTFIVRLPIDGAAPGEPWLLAS